MGVTLLISKPTWEVRIIPWFWRNSKEVTRSQTKWHSSKSTARDTDMERDTWNSKKKCAQRPHCSTNLHTIQGFSEAQKEIKRKHKAKFLTCPHCIIFFLFHLHVMQQSISKICGTLLVPFIRSSANEDFLIFLCITIILVYVIYSLTELGW